MTRLASSLTFTTPVHDEPKLTIHTDAKKRGRSFEGIPLAYARFDSASDTDRMRPILLIVAATPDTARALSANLRAGRAATIHAEHLSSSGIQIEMPRSFGYRESITHCVDDGAVVLHYHLPDVFDLAAPSSGDGEAVRFVVMPSLEDMAALVEGLDREVAVAIAYAKTLGYPFVVDRTFVELAAFVVAALGRRLEAPLPIPDRLSFRVQFLMAMLDVGAATMRLPPVGRSPGWGEHIRMGFRSWVLGIRMHQGIAIGATEKALEELLVREVGRFDTAMRAFRGTSNARA